MDFRICKIKDSHLQYMKIEADEVTMILGRKAVRDLKTYITTLNPKSEDRLIVEVGGVKMIVHNDPEFKYVGFWFQSEYYIGGTTVSYEFVADLAKYLKEEW